MLPKRSQRRIEAATISSLQNDETAGGEARKEEVPVSPEEPEVSTGSPSRQQEPASAIIPRQLLCWSLVQAVPYGRVHYQVSGCSLVVGAAEGGGGGCCRRVSPGDKKDEITPRR